MYDDHEQPPPATIRRVAVDEIYVPEGRRIVDPTMVAALAESIAAQGMLQPIRLYSADRGVPVLVAGAHRLEAVKALGWSHIEAIEDADADEVRAELIEIDENLIRAELSPAERAAATARRKAIYETLHPAAAHGSPCVCRQVGDTRPRANVDRFTSNTAAATGRSERTVQRDAERGEKIDADAMALVRGTRLDTGAYLDTLKRLAPAAQFARAESDLRAGVAKAATTVELDADGIPTAEAAPPITDTLVGPEPVPKVMRWQWDDPRALVNRAIDLVGAERVAEWAMAAMEHESAAAQGLSGFDEDGALPDDTEEDDDVLDAA